MNRARKALSLTMVLWVPVAVRAGPPEEHPVTPPGPGIMRMKLQRVQTSPGRITVTTTGARYVFDGGGNEIACFQRIGADRKVAGIRVKPSAGFRVADLAVSMVSDAECILKAGKVTVSVRNDSYLRLAGVERGSLELTCALDSARARNVSTRQRWPWGHNREIAGFFDGRGGVVSYGDVPAFAVMPPRAFDWGAFFELRPNQLGCELWGLKGTDKVVEENRRLGVNLFIIWGGAAWETAGHDARRPYVPKDPPAFRRAVDKVHALGAKVVVYLTGGSLGERGTPANYLRRIGELVGKYGIDGVYHDGPSRSWTREQMYDFLRNQKKRFPKLLCFMHQPLDPLAEAYLDGKIIGEFDRKKGTFNPDAMDSRQWSNAVVFWVPDHNMGRCAKTVNTVLAHRARMYWGFLPETDLPGKPPLVRLWRDHYMAKLDLMRLEHLRTRGEVADPEYARRKEALRQRLGRFRQAEQSDRSRLPPGLVGKATASSQEGVIYCPDDHLPALAADGSLETCWLAAADRPNKWDWHSNHAMSLASLRRDRMARQWLQLDLGKEQTVGRVVYDTHWPGEGSRDLWQESFRISASPDGRRWTALAAKSGLEEARRFEVTLDKPVKVRYVRVDGIRSRCRRVEFWHAAYVTELQVYAAGD